jgi:hypothetical protein
MTLDRVMVYARGSLTYSITSYEQSGKDSDNTIALSAALGGDIEITDNILFFLELGFVDYEHFWIEDYNTDTFTIAFTTPSPSIGILFRF